MILICWRWFSLTSYWQTVLTNGRFFCTHINDMLLFFISVVLNLLLFLQSDTLCHSNNAESDALRKQKVENTFLKILSGLTIFQSSEVICQMVLYDHQDDLSLRHMWWLSSAPTEKGSKSQRSKIKQFERTRYWKYIVRHVSSNLKNSFYALCQILLKLAAVYSRSSQSNNVATVLSSLSNRLNFTCEK